MFGHSMIPIINKPTRVNKKNETAIDHIFINSVTATTFKTGVIRSDILDHFQNSLQPTTIFILMKQRTVAYLGGTLLIFPWTISNINCTLLAQTLLIRIILMKTLLKFLAHFMASASRKRKLKQHLKITVFPGWITKGIQKSSKKNRNCMKNS